MYPEVQLCQGNTHSPRERDIERQRERGRELIVLHPTHHLQQQSLFHTDLCLLITHTSKCSSSQWARAVKNSYFCVCVFIFCNHFTLVFIFTSWGRRNLAVLPASLLGFWKLASMSPRIRSTPLRGRSKESVAAHVSCPDFFAVSRRKKKGWFCFYKTEQVSLHI